MKFLSKIKTPSLLLNETVCRRNIERMSLKANVKKIDFRPHFKTHVSAEIGNWFRDAGVTAITVSSVAMARFFAINDWNDITIAFPVNIREIDGINELASRITLRLVVENAFAADFLGRNLKNRAGIFLKVDTGYHRTGIAPENQKLFDEVLSSLDKYDNMEFMGFLTHSGQTYKVTRKDAVIEIHKQAVSILHTLKNRYIDQYPNLILSVGDTPSCSIVEDLGDIDEIRPGNFVFYDLMQERIGSCSYDDIALVMACPVVAKHPGRREIVIFGGAVHLSKEFIAGPDGNPCFGLVVEPLSDGWSDPVAGVWVSSLSQEHGVIKSDNKTFFDKTGIGDLVLILPVHSCLTANLMKEFRLLDNRIIS
ncbi:MAG: alanine racemase [Bacteroidales bacterium]|nr:alanine racemase [Bacteroidales bacterium]